MIDDYYDMWDKATIHRFAPRDDENDELPEDDDIDDDGEEPDDDELELEDSSRSDDKD